jgi:hypothetical protein
MSFVYLVVIEVIEFRTVKAARQALSPVVADVRRCGMYVPVPPVQFAGDGGFCRNKNNNYW